MLKSPGPRGAWSSAGAVPHWLSSLDDATSLFCGNVSLLLGLAGDGQSRYCGLTTGASGPVSLLG